MKKLVILAAMMTSMLMYMLSSCYRNKEDILALPLVSFRSDVVPIVTAGACGCHNNGKISNAVPFSHVDTIFYDAILARVGLLNTWVSGGSHPGGGAIELTPSQMSVIKNWITQGAKDDGGGCTVTGAITYNAKIFPIYSTTCKGATCHEGLSAKLDYPKMFSSKDKLLLMMNSSGATGHPGPVLSLSSCVSKTFLEWINQGQPQ
jgi:hypothetical protein